MLTTKHKTPYLVQLNNVKAITVECNSIKLSHIHGRILLFHSDIQRCFKLASRLNARHLNFIRITFEAHSYANLAC